MATLYRIQIKDGYSGVYYRIDTHDAQRGQEWLWEMIEKFGPSSNSCYAPMTIDQFTTEEKSEVKA